MCALQCQELKLSLDNLGAPWQGWGTSLCWMGKVYGQRDDLADVLFTLNEVKLGAEILPGLGMNIVRYNAGACSWNTVEGRQMVKSEIILPYRQVEAFWMDPTNPDPNSQGWNWSVDANQREMMLKAKRRGADKFELFSNSPIWWMCKNDNPSGAPNASDDNLREDHYEAFAKYLAEVAVHSQKFWGVKFTTVDPFNEPLSWWWDANCKQEGCHFSVPAQNRLLPMLRKALDERGLKNLPIAASDETHVTHAIQAWEGFDERTKRIIKQLNVHGYEGVDSPRKKLRESVGSLPVWLSEHGEDDRSGLTLAKSLIRDVNALGAVAWCYWQPLDGSGWGLIDADPPAGTIGNANAKYFVLAQFSRHIRKGMRMLKLASEDTLAAYHSRSKKLVIVVINAEKQTVSRKIDLAEFTTKADSIQTWRTEFHGKVRHQRVESPSVVGDSLDAQLPAESILTIELRAESK